MARRLKLITIISVLIFSFSLSTAFALNIDETRTTVVNSLPAVNIYMDTDRLYNANLDNTTVLINDEKTDLEYAGSFSETGDSVTYYIMVDLSRSITHEDFEIIKSGIINFAQNLTSDDSVILVPFGEDIYATDDLYNPLEEEFENKIKELNADDNYTQLYNAIDTVKEIHKESSYGNELSRSVALVFTDGSDITTGGYVNDTELSESMKSEGLPLYGFIVGNNRDAKDKLGVLCRNLNGDIVSVNKNNINNELQLLNKIIDNTFTVKTNVRNSESIGVDFSVRVMVDNKQILSKDKIKTNKTEDSKDVLLVAIRKFIIQYWWGVLALAIAIIVCIVLFVIRKNKGVMIIDGKVVYGSKVQKKYHIQVKDYNTRELHFNTSINGRSGTDYVINIVESIIVGRSEICDVTVEDPNMSRQHFYIELNDRELYLTDLGSKSGTFVNGIKVYSKQRLYSGDIISAGKTQIKVNW